MAYTREAGVRNLERELATICRKIARKVAEGQEQTFHIHTGNVHRWLGMRKYLPEIEQQRDEVGVATSLAWTEAGGVMMHAEATVMDGTGQLLLTGSLGEVMKESAQAALSYTRARARDLGIPQTVFRECDLHIHVPAGAIPKDGPSAGNYARRCPHFGTHGHTGVAYGGHEWRNHPARAGSASGWGEGKAVGSESGLAYSASCCQRAIVRMWSTWPPSSAVVCALCSYATMDEVLAVALVPRVTCLLSLPLGEGRGEGRYAPCAHAVALKGLSPGLKTPSLHHDTVVMFFAGP